MTLDISEAFNKVQHVGLLHKLNIYGIFCQLFVLILSLSALDGQMNGFALE